MNRVRTPGERYHQQYLSDAENPNGYCGTGVKLVTRPETSVGRSSRVRCDTWGHMISAETPLLPDVVRAYPFSWGSGFIWPPETEESERNLAYARDVLEACLPRAVLASPEPPEEPTVWGCEGDAYPEWTGIRAVLRGRMPYARHVTAERMADAEAECARQGIDTTDFEEIWTRRIIAWIAEQTLHWCGLMVDDEKALTPWLMDLSELYVQRGMAAEKAVWALRCTEAVPESRAALTRLATYKGAGRGPAGRSGPGRGGGR